jgi:hypothetical protein
MLEPAYMNKLNRGFSQLRDDELGVKAQAVIAALTGNAAFPSPAPKLETVQSALTAYEAALAMPDGVARTAQVAATRGPLENLLRQLASNLELTADVTDAQLATTGFDLPRDKSRTSEPVMAPGNVRLKSTGTSGEVQVLCDSVNRAKSYHVQYTLDPNTGQWTDGGIFGNTRGMKLAGLQRGKDYWARVRAVGPDGPGGWSDPATIMAT